MDKYPDLFRQTNPLSESTCYVVKNLEMAGWLKRYLADRFGTVLGLSILTINEAMPKFYTWYANGRRKIREWDMGNPYSDAGTDTEIMQDADYPHKAKALLSRSEMKLAIYKALEELLAGEVSLFKPIKAYLDKAPHNGKSEWLWQFVDSIADAFAFYDLNFPVQWRKSETTWQHLLWKRIFHTGIPYGSLGSELSEIVASKGISRSNSARVVILLPGLIEEQILRFIQHMGKEHEVHHLLVMPMWTRKPVQTFISNSSLAARHMALLCRRLGAAESEIIPVKIEAGETLLERLRESLRNDIPMQGAISDDGSLGIHDVCGPHREIEVLKNLILAALQDDESLAPSEIAVLAPDISLYAPYIQTVFPSADDEQMGRADHLQYALMDMPNRFLAPYPMALKTLISLPGSRFGRHALLSLFGNPCFAPTAGQPELASEWKRLVLEFHVRWGSTAEHRREEGAYDVETGTWESAFKRLLTAYYYDEDDSSGLLPARYFGDADTRGAGKLICVVRNLDEKLRQLHKKVFSLTEWVNCWLEITKEWLVAQPDDKDERRIQEKLKSMIKISKRLDDFSDFSNPGISWPVFSAFLDELCFPSRVHHDYFVGSGVICSSIRNLRCIPFRRIYMLGMNEGAWPTRHVLQAFDLRNTMENYDEFSREAEDRLCFLEILFSARDSVSFLYTGKESEFGNRLSPAAPIVELMEHLGEGARILLRRHPLAPYHPSTRSSFGEGNQEDSFNEAEVHNGKIGMSESKEQIDSYLPQHLAMARSLHEKSVRPESPAKILPEEETDSIDWQALVEFLRNPVKYFYRRRIGVARPEVPDDFREYDVLEPDYLEWWNWRRRMVLESPEILSSATNLLESFRDYIRREGSVSNTLVNELWAERWLADSESLASSLKDYEGLESPFSCRLLPRADYLLQSDRLVHSAQEGSRIHPVSGNEILLPAPWVGRERKLYISGLISGLRLLPGNSDGSVWTMLDFASVKELGSKHNLRTWIVALMIGNALGTKGPRELRILHLGRGGSRVRRYFFESPSPEIGQDCILIRNSEELLETLLEVFRAGQRAPIPLYPELADKIEKFREEEAMAENKDVKRKDYIASLAERAWDELLNSNWGVNTIKNCHYQRFFLGQPDFASEIFARAWNNLYLKGGLIPRRASDF